MTDGAVGGAASASPDASGSTSPSPPTDGAAPADAAAPAAEPAALSSTPPAPVASASAPARAGDRTDDGIDDENWLPRSDTPAFAAFQTAVEMARREPGAAVGAFVEAARKTSGFYAAWFNAGAAAEQAGRPGDAEAHYRKALEVRGDYGLALANLAALLGRTGRDDEATQLLDDALRRYPEKAGPHLATALRALARTDLAGAEASARSAMKFDERNVAAMSVMSRVFHAQGRLDTARFAIDNALALEPGNALLHLERGSILLAQQDGKDALVAFERAARLRPTLAEAQEAYGLSLLDHGFPVDAERAFQALVALEPRLGSAQLHLGNALRANKKYPEAEAAYRRALELDPALEGARFNLGVLYIDNALPGVDELGRLQRAVDELKTYRDKGVVDVALKKRVDEYIDATEKRIAKERKRREREEKRKADEARKAADEAAKAKEAPAATSPAPGVESTPAPAPEVTPAPGVEAAPAPAPAPEVVPPPASAPEGAPPETPAPEGIPPSAPAAEAAPASPVWSSGAQPDSLDPMTGRDATRPSPPSPLPGAKP